MFTVKNPHYRAAEACTKVTGQYWIETLQDGGHVLIRQLTDKDREREYAFIKRLSPESRHMRFLSRVNEPQKAMAGPWLDIDNKQRMAYIALVHEDGQLIEIGVSRYGAMDEHKCECTVTVAEEWKQLGLGTLLMEHLITAARKNAFHHIYAVDESSNAPMRALARSLGFETRDDPFETRKVVHLLYL
ncbi:GNAT family N-acetyltransferase [Pseudomonas sp. NPDC087336]|uniref:GNAT family N-acetyltransferase n=1 Tax=Pseudomonas sp. NPDC087336 TaxID=3364436 RepID=UPI003820D112